MIGNIFFNNPFMVFYAALFTDLRSQIRVKNKEIVSNFSSTVKKISKRNKKQNLETIPKHPPLT